jgi:hypothetical protein
MTNGDDYQLSRVAYSEWNEQFKKPYLPWRDQRPSFMRRLLAAVLESHANQAPKAGFTISKADPLRHRR